MATEKVACPICQAETAPGRKCWLCHFDLSTVPAGVSSGAASSALPSAPAYESPSIANPYAAPIPLEETAGAAFPTIVLVIGLIVVFIAMFFVAPGLATLLVIVVAPALIRTALVVARKRREGEDVSTGEKSILFLASAAGVIAATTAAVAAFFIACSASCYGLFALERSVGGRGVQNLAPVALGGAAILGLVVGGFTLHRLWRRKK